MAAKIKTSRLESEIEKCRCDSNWSRALDLARQVSSKSSSAENFATFIYGEGRLEKHLLEHPACEKNIAKAQDELPESLRLFQMVLHSDSKQPAMLLDIQLLTAKIYYAMGEYTNALQKYATANMESIDLEQSNSRRLRIVAEAYAIKGLCLEKTTPSSPKIPEHEDEIIKCFEKSGDISLCQLQPDKGKGLISSHGSGTWNFTDGGDTTGLGPMVELAIQRSPIHHIKKGEVSKGVGQFRELLRAVETRAMQSLRQTLARQLAEVLLRGVCESNYKPYDEEEARKSPHILPMKPKKYSGDGLFLPQDQSEETLLLLLISESMANREAVLNRSLEHKETRLHTFHNSTAVYDLLTITLVRKAQFHMLSETFERAMKFSFDEFHIWYQFALSLICAHKYVRAALVLKECVRLQPKNAVVKLQVAKLCYEHLHMIDEGIKYAKEAIDNSQGSPLLARSFLVLGICYSMKAAEAKMQSDRQEYQRKALNTFFRSTSMDPNDHIAHFHLALQMAILRQIPEALKIAQQGLNLRYDHIHSLHLLVLLLSANKQYEEALELAESALSEHPDHFSLWFTRCKLEEVVYGVEEALQTCKAMFKLWKEVCEHTLENDQRGTGLLDKVAADHRSLLQLQLSELSDRDSGSMRADSIAASKVEQTLSEVASSVTSSQHPKHGPQKAWILQAQIWLHLAELYLDIDRLNEANACISEANTIVPISHMVSYMKGRLHEVRGELSEARTHYENAIAINPGHVKSMQHLGMVVHHLGNKRLAEKILRDAISSDPTANQSWDNLGKVLQSLEEYDAATECLMTAVKLEATSPIASFTIIPKALD